MLEKIFPGGHEQQRAYARAQAVILLIVTAQSIVETYRDTAGEVALMFYLAMLIGMLVWPIFALVGSPRLILVVFASAIAVFAIELQVRSFLRAGRDGEAFELHGVMPGLPAIFWGVPFALALIARIVWKLTAGRRAPLDDNDF